MRANTQTHILTGRRMLWKPPPSVCQEGEMVKLTKLLHVSALAGAKMGILGRSGNMTIS